MAEQRLAIFCGPPDGNSTARICSRLANGFVAAGTPTDLLFTATPQPVHEDLAAGVAGHDLGRLRLAPRLAAWLWRVRPTALLTHRIRENLLALQASALLRRLTGLSIPVFVTAHGPIGFKLAHLSPRRRRQRTREVLDWYPRNRAIVAISAETATDLRALLGPVPRIEVIPNPIVTAALLARATGPVAHPWLAIPKAARPAPVLLFAGRFVREKDLPTLLAALALLVRDRDARLVLLGDGPLREDLLAHIARLGLQGRVALPGFAPNPYPDLAAADLVVLSSVWDALPTVLIEALALGTPVVSTACGAGPREILGEGRYGALVPPGEPAALAAALAATLADPPPPAVLREGAGRYDAAYNAERYRRLLLGGGPSVPDGAGDHQPL